MADIESSFLLLILLWLLLLLLLLTIYFETFMLHFYDPLLLYSIAVAYEDLEPSTSW